ncbi:MAG: RsmB/NOP family class I SAM-dependent RNA methyltransferase, partial [Pseudomonadota bacterium]
LYPRDLSKSAPFDVVLCDVPCSGSGTWRRSPEAKWQLTPERLQTLLKIQRDILRCARDLIQPGGHLIYTTCSCLRRENEAQISRFCQDFPDMSLYDQMSWPVSATGDGFFFAALSLDP